MHKYKDGQSGYKKQHSTETLLLKVTNDLLVVADKKSATVLLMLDLSAAFDTVDHSKLLDILYHEIGLRGTVLKWFKSFIVGRMQKVRIGDCVSNTITIEFGVPQGSVLGPVLFNIYIRSLYSILVGTGFQIEGYADDHQVYKPFTPLFQVKVLTDDIPKCFDSISNWMLSYFLRLNPAKTKILVFGPDSVLQNITIHGVILHCGTCIRFSSTSKNLGVIFDSHLNFDAQVSSVIKKCYRSLRNLCKIKPYLTSKQMETLVCSLILSSLDYSNSLYYGINKGLLNKMQVVQNCAARLIFGKRRRESASDLLRRMH